jgi:hypothetical protein
MGLRLVQSQHFGVNQWRPQQADQQEQPANAQLPQVFKPR